MKKIALLAATTAAASLALAPAAFADAAPIQKLTVKLTSTTAGTKKKPKSVGITVITGTTNKTDTPDKTKFTITDAKISLPKGIKLNYGAFPACDLPTTEPEVKQGQWCADNAPTSAIGSGTARAEVVDVPYEPTGILTPYIGTNGRLIIRTQFDQPAVIDQPLIGNISTGGGAYSFGFKVPTELQTPLENADQQILDFSLKFAKKTATVKKKKVGLVELNKCPAGGYKFKGEFTFKGIPGTTLAETVVKCKQGK